MQGSSDDERKARKRKKFDLQRLLLSDASDEEPSDDSESLGFSQSESFQNSEGSNGFTPLGTSESLCSQDSDSSWDLQKRKVFLQSNRDANRRRGDDRTDHEVTVKSNWNSKREKKPIPVEYSQYSQQPPTRAQCEDSGRDVWNAVGAFYASQPPPPERTMPYFE